MKNSAVLVLALLASGCIGVGPGSAASPRPGGAAWGGAGIGVGSAGFLGQLDLNHQSGTRLLRARLNGHDNMGSSWNSDGGGPKTVSELAVLAGRGRICCGGRWGAVAGGLGLVKGSSGWAPAHTYTTVGVAAEAFFITPQIPHLEISAIGNLNTERPFIGFAASLAIGRMPFLTAPRVIRRRFPPF